MVRGRPRFDTKLCRSLVGVGHPEEFQYQRHHTDLTVGQPKQFASADRIRASVELPTAMRLFAGQSAARTDLTVVFDVGSRRRVGLHIAASVPTRWPLECSATQHEHSAATGVHSRRSHSFGQQKSATKLYSKTPVNHISSTGTIVPE